MKTFITLIIAILVSISVAFPATDIDQRQINLEHKAKIKTRSEFLCPIEAYLQDRSMHIVTLQQVANLLIIITNLNSGEVIEVPVYNSNSCYVNQNFDLSPYQQGDYEIEVIADGQSFIGHFIL